MSACLFLLAFLDSGTVWQIGDTDIYTPLSTESVAIMPDEVVFILDKAEKRILIYDKGTRVGTFGEKGQGPGEFMFPKRIILDGDHIWVEDMMNRAFMRFGRDGTYIDQIRFEDFPGQTAKIKDGWAQLESKSMFGKSIDPGQIFIRNAAFAEKKLVLDLRPPGFEPPTNDGITIDIGKPMPHNPTPEKPCIAVNGDGTRIFISEPGQRFTLHVLDHKGKLLRKIVEDWPSIPFDEDWGKAHIEALNNRPSNGQIKLTFEGDFPDTFPHVKRLTCIGDKIYVERWQAWVEKNPLLTVLDFDGNEVPSPIPAGSVERIETIIGDHAYVLTFDVEAEVAGVAKVSLASLAGFLKANPIPEGFEAGGGVMILN
jgi:hypothetical protein